MFFHFFLIYTAEVLDIARRHAITTHSYAIDTQLYNNAAVDLCGAGTSGVASCIDELGRLMHRNPLKRNTDKMNFVLLGMRQQLDKAN